MTDYARGYKAWGLCKRSGRRMLLKDLVEDDHVPGMLVDPDWYEPRHPQEFPFSTADPEAIWKPASEVSVDGGTPFELLSADLTSAGSPNETILTGDTGTNLFTMTAAGGYSPYTYRYTLFPGAPVQIVLQSPTTFLLRVPAGTSTGTISLTIVATVTDSLGQQSTDTLSAVITIAASTFEEVAATAVPSHWWKLQDDSYTTFIDSGFATPRTLTPAGASTFWAKHAPCAFIGLSGAQGYGVRHTTTGPIDFRSTTPAAATATGAMACWIRCNSSTTALPRVMAQRYVNNPGIFVELRVVNNGGLRVEVQVNNNSSSIMKAESPIGSIVAGVWYFIAVIQNGSGPVIYINGAAVTTTITLTNAGLNSWWFSTLNAIHGTPTEGLSVLGGYALPNNHSGSFQHVMLWEGSPPAGSVITALYDAGARSLKAVAVPRANSFYDQVRSKFDPKWWLAFSRNAAVVGTGFATQYGYDGDTYGVSYEANDSGFTGPLVNTANDLSADAIRFFDSPGPQGDVFFNSSGGVADAQIGTTGTLIVWMQPTDVVTTKTVFAHGNGATYYIRMQLLNANFRFNWTTSSGANFYRVTLTGHTAVAGQWYMFTVTHDGTTLRFFVNGTEYSGGALTIATAGTATQANSWFTGLAQPAADYRGSGINGSASVEPMVGQLSHQMYDQKVLTPAEIAAIYTGAAVAA